VVFLPFCPHRGDLLRGILLSSPGCDLSDSAAKVDLHEGFQIVVCAHAGSSVGGPTCSNGVAQTGQGLVRRPLKAALRRGCTWCWRVGEMMGAENAAMRIDVFSIAIGGSGCDGVRPA